MCVIMYGKVKNILALDLKSAWDTNPHGAGIIIPSEHPRALKGMMNYNRFLFTLKILPNYSEVVVHLRMATHGKVDTDNTHPFKINADSFLMHNGILSGLGEYGDKGRSDSAHLTEIITRLPHKDRVSILSALPGKYAYVRKHIVHLIGDFEKADKVTMSNTYWMPGKITDTWREMHEAGKYCFTG